MSQCLNPNCLAVNSKGDPYCKKCGSSLILRSRYRALKIIGQGGFGRNFKAIDEDKPSKPYCVIKQSLPQGQGTDNLKRASELFTKEGETLDRFIRFKFYKKSSKTELRESIRFC